MTVKATLRHLFLEKRRNVSTHEREYLGKKAADMLALSPIFQSAQHVGAYLAAKDEFDCTPIIHLLWQYHKHCYVPVIHPNRHKHFMMASYTPETSLVLNQYHLLQPAQPSSIIDPGKLDLILVPLIAWDSAYHRIGMGGGYYDRVLHAVMHLPKRPFLLGLAYPCQHSNNPLPQDPWDITLDAVLSPEIE